MIALRPIRRTRVSFCRGRLRGRLRVFERLVGESGSATAEYAIATLAAVGFAGLLVVILRSDAVRGMLTNLIQHALSYSG